jgi:hypothetical protein
MLRVDDPALRIPNPDGDNNPRPWGAITCPAGDWLVGVVVYDLGAANPGLIDGFVPVCAPRDRLGDRARAANSDVDPPQAGATQTELDCPAGEVVVGLAYADALDGSDNLTGVDPVCGAPAGGPRRPLGDGGPPGSIELDCTTGEVAVGMAYKDASGILSDAAESVTLICRPATCP